MNDTWCHDQDDTNNDGIRHREKDRIATCAFADQIANISISQADMKCNHWREQGDTVLATVVALFHKNQELSVLSIGIGTKFMKSVDIAQDHEGHKIHDSHAEVLAKRGFQLFLMRDVERILDDKEGILLCKKNDKFIRKEDITLHFYTSSAPCGNSTIRRWASSKKEKTHPDFAATFFDWPRINHDKIHICSQHEGQIAASWKRDPSITDEMIANCESTQVIAPGTAPIACSSGRILSCSDKFLFWNALGMQGGKLIQYIEPIYMDTIVVGRKFARVHLQRALCCRIQDIRPTGVFRVQHPTVLCTCIKLSYETIFQQSKASFGDTTCFSWTMGDTKGIQIFGDLGIAKDLADCDNPISNYSLTRQHASLLSRMGLPISTSDDAHDDAAASLRHLGSPDNIVLYRLHKHTINSILIDVRPRKRRRDKKP